jgi:hypothetical protein
MSRICPSYADLDVPNPTSGYKYSGNLVISSSTGICHVKESLIVTPHNTRLGDKCITGTLRTSTIGDPGYGLSIETAPWFINPTLKFMNAFSTPLLRPAMPSTYYNSAHLRRQ